MPIHAIRPLRDVKLAVLMINTDNHLRTRANRPARDNTEDRSDIRDTEEKHLFVNNDDDRQRNCHDTATDDGEPVQLRAEVRKQPPSSHPPKRGM